MKWEGIKRRLAANPKVDEAWEEDCGCFWDDATGTDVGGIYVRLADGWLSSDGCTSLHEPDLAAVLAALDRASYDPNYSDS